MTSHHGSAGMLRVRIWNVMISFNAVHPIILVNSILTSRILKMTSLCTESIEIKFRTYLKHVNIR